MSERPSGLRMRRTSFGLAFAIAWAALAGAAPIACLHAQGPASASASADSDPPPSAPDTVTAVALGETEVEVAWTAVTDAEGGVEHYKVYRDGEHVGSPELLLFTDTGLAPGTTYEYRVSAVDSKNREGAKSDPATATTLGDGDDDDDDDGDDDDGGGDGDDEADDTPPTAPADLQAEATAPRRVELSWEAASDPESGVASYNVYRDGLDAGSTTGTSLVDNAVEPETTYSYEVTAVNGDGLEGPPSEPATVTTPAEEDDTPPTAPGNLQAEATAPRRVELTWEAASDPESGVASYRVYRDGVRVGSPSSTSFVDAGVEPETAYEYEVTAVNGGGVEGQPSGPASVTTPAEPDTTPPAPPTGLRIIR